MRCVTVLAGVAVFILCAAPVDAARDVDQNTAVAPAIAASSEKLAAPRVDPIALKMRSERARLLYMVGKRQCARAHYVEGIRALKEAHGIERHPDLLFEMAACHAKAGRMQAAFEEHRRYVESFKEPVKRLVAAARFGAIMRRVREAAKAKSAPMPKAP